MKERLDKFIKNPKKALFKFSLPIMVAMLVQTMYSIVDTAYIGRLGAEAIAAVTFSFPVFFILMALGSGMSTGMSSLISRYLGAENKTAAENTAVHGIILAVIGAVFLSALGFLFIKPLVSLFGAEDVVFSLAIDYLHIIFFGIVFMFPSFIMTNIFVAQGDTKTPMKIQISALVLNIILDPIFIYGLGYGVRGAAIATTISFGFGLILAVFYLIRKSYLRIHWDCFNLSGYITKEIFIIGIPASLTMLLISFYMIFINRIMAHFGTDYIASFGIAARLDSVVLMPVMAIAIGIMTLVGMFKGAKKYGLLKEISYYGIKVGVLIAIVLGAIFFIMPSLLLRMFTNDTNLLMLGSAYLRVIVFGYPFMAVGIIVSRVMQGMGYGMPSLVLSLVRILFVAVPLAYVFVFVFGFGYLSIGAAVVIGGLVANAVALVWLKVKIAKLHNS